jgi:hypothetical protein
MGKARSKNRTTETKTTTIRKRRRKFVSWKKETLRKQGDK